MDEAEVYNTHVGAGRVSGVRDDMGCNSGKARASSNSKRSDRASVDGSSGVECVCQSQ